MLSTTLTKAVMVGWKKEVAGKLLEMCRDWERGIEPGSCKDERAGSVQLDGKIC